jgi:hypothetical protein
LQFSNVKFHNKVWEPHSANSLEASMQKKLLVALVATLALAALAWAQPTRPRGKPVSGFQGYWMGIDPVDGGDARRSLVQLPNGRFALAARDSVLSLCDSTDRGLGSFDDGELVSPTVLTSDALTLKCFNNGASVTLHVRFELVGENLMTEVATLATGTPVSTIVFHRVSEE